MKNLRSCRRSVILSVQFVLSACSSNWNSIKSDPFVFFFFSRLEGRRRHFFFYDFLRLLLTEYIIRYNGAPLFVG